MSTASPVDLEVAVVGAGVVGCAVALALARHGLTVALLEAEPATALGASGTNSGIVHTGFDSPVGELETEMILASAGLRDQVLEALEIPVLWCGAEMTARDESERQALAALERNAQRNGVAVALEDDVLTIPGEAVTDPVAYTLSLAAAAEAHGADLRTGWRLAAVDARADDLLLRSTTEETVRCRLLVNCAGLHADDVARLAGDGSFEIYPRKGEFLVFDVDASLERILLPIPSDGTKGVLVFPTLDGMVVAGPTAVDLEDKDDWSVRPGAREEIVGKAASIFPPIADAEPIAAYAGLRPAGRGGANYLIARSRACARLINVAAIRSTGLTASLGIGQRVLSLVAAAGARLGPEEQLKPGVPALPTGPWWRRTAEHRALA